MDYRERVSFRARGVYLTQDTQNWREIRSQMYQQKN